MGWTAEEVVRAYRESTPAMRAVLDHLADRPGREVSSLELARAVYPHDGDAGAQRRLYGLLGAFGRRSYGYGKEEWFFSAYRKHRPDGSLALGHFGYVMPAEQAAWLKERPMIEKLTTHDVAREITRTGSAPALAYERYLAAPGERRLDALVRAVLGSMNFAGGPGFVRAITVNDYLGGLPIVEEAVAALGGRPANPRRIARGADPK